MLQQGLNQQRSHEKFDATRVTTSGPLDVQTLLYQLCRQHVQQLRENIGNTYQWPVTMHSAKSTA